MSPLGARLPTPYGRTMLRYSLQCSDGHAFESWFASAAAYDELARRRLLTCARCGSSEVTKALMAPAVATRDATVAKAPEGAAPDSPPLPLRDADEVKRAKLVDQFRRHLESNSDNVGLRFASEARAIHDGLSPERPIHGEASPAEARALFEDGIPVLPLPFLPTRKAN